MDRWYGTDELRQSWYLLTITTDSRAGERFIASCEIGDGNQDQLFETEQLTAGDSDEEAELLEKLSTRLDERRYTGVTLITASTDTLAMLRTRLLECNQIEKPTLRGFRHVSLRQLSTNYFAGEWPDQVPNLSNNHREGGEGGSGDDRTHGLERASVTGLWETRTAIGPLVPPDALLGTPL
jgi:hypothetical protein